MAAANAELGCAKPYRSLSVERKNYLVFVVFGDQIHSDVPLLKVGDLWPNIAHSIEIGVLTKMVVAGLAKENNVFHDDPRNFVTIQVVAGIRT